jgi:hypothetical protein
MRNAPSSRCGASPEFVIGQYARAGHKRILDRDRGLRLLDIDPRELGGAARGVARAGDDREQRLAVEQDLRVGEQGLVGESRGDVVPAGYVGRGQHSDDAVGGADCV